MPEPAKVPTPEELTKDYRWWFWDVIDEAVGASATEHNSQTERLAVVPGEGFRQYIDEDGHVFAVELHVEYQGLAER